MAKTKTFWFDTRYKIHYYSLDGGHTLHPTDPKKKHLETFRDRESARDYKYIGEEPKKPPIDFTPPKTRCIRDIVDEIRNLGIEHPELSKLLDDIDKRTKTYC